MRGVRTILMPIAAHPHYKGREGDIPARGHCLASGLSLNYRQKVMRGLFFPCQHKFSLRSAKPINDDLILISYCCIELNFAGVKPAAIFVAIERHEIGEARTRINGQQRIKSASPRFKPGDTRGGGLPGVPDRFASRLSSVVCFAQLKTRIEIV